jgi:hypothetical protein
VDLQFVHLCGITLPYWLSYRYMSVPITISHGPEAFV